MEQGSLERDTSADTNELSQKTMRISPLSLRATQSFRAAACNSRDPKTGSAAITNFI